MGWTPPPSPPPGASPAVLARHRAALVAMLGFDPATQPAPRLRPRRSRLPALLTLALAVAAAALVLSR